MIGQRRVLWLGLLAMACGGSKSGAGTTAQPESTVGKPAVLPDEARTDLFSGFVTNEVVIGSCAACGDDPCVANHFQGRATCPYGQTQEEIDTLPPSDPWRCRAANEDGTLSTNPVSVPVSPQRLDRLAEDTMICSCQCAGPDASMPPGGWCACPSSMECAPLVMDLGAGSSMAGYCIPLGTAYDPKLPAGGTCDKHGTDPATDCGNGRRNP